MRAPGDEGLGPASQRPAEPASPGRVPTLAENIGVKRVFSKRLLANTRGENGEETTKDPRNPFTPCAFAAWAASKPISSSKPISRHHRKQRKTGLPRTAFGADSNALITPQNMKNMKLDVNSYADHACGARRAPETTPNPAQPLARPPHFASPAGSPPDRAQWRWR